MSRNAYFFLLFVLLLVACFAYQEEGTRLPQSGVEEENRYSGGENFTSFDFGENAFGGQGDGLSREESRFFASGNNLFRTNWVVAPASVESLDGVGPLFNANSCGSCHFKDGRAAPFDVLKKGRLGILWRLSIPGIGLHGAPRKHPVYGGQIQDQSIPQATPEAQVRTTYQSIAGQYADGTPYTLQKPIYELTDLAYGPLDEALMLSPRVAPHVAGLGLLESISEADLLQHADPDDRDGDGISGRANRVWNIVEQQVTMGRFGWKANEPTVRQQNAGAFNGDMGLTSNLFPKDEFSPQQDQRHPGIPNGGQPEVSDQQLDRITLYVKALAVPAKRNTADPQFAEGKALFAQLQC
ncbi:MAG: di-heme oxidoredictase family protein, partial [Bacteroidota bacterium]